MPLKDAHGDALDGGGIASRAQAVEAAGLDGIWLGDSFSPGMTRPDPLMWLLVAATATTTIEVGTSILIVPLRQPVELAQRLLTLHAITRGRFSLGAGAGSGKSAYDVFGLDFEQRFSLLESHLAEIKRLCAGEVVGTANLNPWPRVRGGPPILIGSWHSHVWLRRAVEQYDGWMCSAGRTNLATMREAIKRYRDLGGGRAMVSTCMVDLRAPTTRMTEDDSFHLRCAPTEAAERLQQLVELGFDDVLLVKADHTQRLSIYEADFTGEDLEEIRALLPHGSQ
jgi:alkanesulfonate monooxygenase SsuD/methylene tetrahydromethanopterin reductase-like flavin-dependent oxidoreductase (luciferase family)